MGGKSRDKSSKRKGSNAKKDIRKRHRDRLKVAVILAIVGSAVIILFSTSFFIPKKIRKAAILDGLYASRPNSTFIENLTSLLKEAGFQVEFFMGENVTIELLENIGGYDLLILRLHSAIHIDKTLYLFSGEYYISSKYFFEQLSGIAKKAYTFDENEPPYFALNSAFLGMNKKDGLKDSTVILMGCNGTGDVSFIQGLFKRGVKAYFAWDGYVDPSHTDKATLVLVKALCLEALSPREATEKVMKEIGPDPSYESQLYCFTP